MNSELERDSWAEILQENLQAPTMDTINRLREALLRVLSAPDSHNDDQDLFGQLMVQKPQLQKLFDVGPSNPQERREVETG